MVGFSQECAPVRCRDFAPEVDPDWINRSSYLFSLLCADGGNAVSSCDVSLGLFNWALSDIGQVRFGMSRSPVSDVRPSLSTSERAEKWS